MIFWNLNSSELLTIFHSFTLSLPTICSVRIISLQFLHQKENIHLLDNILTQNWPLRTSCSKSHLNLIQGEAQRKRSKKYMRTSLTSTIESWRWSKVQVQMIKFLNDCVVPVPRQQKWCVVFTVLRKIKREKRYFVCKKWKKEKKI